MSAFTPKTNLVLSSFVRIHHLDNFMFTHELIWWIRHHLLLISFCNGSNKSAHLNFIVNFLLIINSTDKRWRFNFLVIVEISAIKCVCEWNDLFIKYEVGNYIIPLLEYDKWLFYVFNFQFSVKKHFPVQIKCNLWFSKSRSLGKKGILD